MLGVAGAYNYGTLKVNDLDTKFRSDMFSLGAYGGYTHESGVYVNATLGYMLGWNDYDVKMALGGRKHGDYDNHAFTGALEVGYQAELAGGYYLTPSVGLSYTHLRQDDWVETLHAGSTPLVANVFDHSRHNVLDIPLSLAVGKEYVCEGFTVRPEVRGSWIYHAKGTRNRIHTGYNGTSQRTTMYAIDRATGTGVVGGGFTARFDSGISVALNYDYEFSDRYRNHNLTGSLSLAF